MKQCLSHKTVRKTEIDLRQVCIGLVWLLLSSGPVSAEESVPKGDPMNVMERSLELGRHEGLLQRKTEEGSVLEEFTSDGCSGGLSAGWSYLASVVPRAREIHGDLPPWESCCIAHDRLYHTGGSPKASADESFEARKSADLALESCVLATGVERTPQLSQEYGLTSDQVITLYELIAELMYRSVRIGGVPCSGLPWQWGYGWPQCD
jgi:hypothetical protein